MIRAYSDKNLSSTNTITPREFVVSEVDEDGWGYDDEPLDSSRYENGYKN